MSIAAAAAFRAAPTRHRPTTMLTPPSTSAACALPGVGSSRRRVTRAAWTLELSTTIARAWSTPMRPARFPSMAVQSRPTSTTSRQPICTTSLCAHRRRSTAALRRRRSTTEQARPSNARATACTPSLDAWTRRHTTTTARPMCPVGYVPTLCSGAPIRSRPITILWPPRAMARAHSTWSAAW